MPPGHRRHRRARARMRGHGRHACRRVRRGRARAVPPAAHDRSRRRAERLLAESPGHVAGAAARTRRHERPGRLVDGALVPGLHDDPARHRRRAAALKGGRGELRGVPDRTLSPRAAGTAHARGRARSGRSRATAPPSSASGWCSSSTGASRTGQPGPRDRALPDRTRLRRVPPVCGAIEYARRRRLDGAWPRWSRQFVAHEGDL